MKKIAVVVMLTAFIAAPALAAEGSKSIGVNYGLDLDGVFGIQGEFDISSATNKAPISVQVFWKNSSRSVLNTTVDARGLGVAGIYDLSAVTKLDKKVRPYVGLGIISEKTETTMPNVGTISASSSSLYVTFGAGYTLTPQFAADLSYNDFGGLTVGANYSF